MNNQYERQTTMLLRPFTLKSHKGVLCGLAITPDNKLCVTMSFDKFNPPARNIDMTEARAGKHGDAFKRRELVSLGAALEAAGV